MALLTHEPILTRITQPTPDEIRAARRRANMSQTEAGLLVCSAATKPYRTWQGYETAVSNKNAHRAIPLATWELFLLLTGQHPSLQVLPSANFKKAA